MNKEGEVEVNNMADFFKDLHEEGLEKLIDHREKVIKKEKEKIENHTKAVETKSGLIKEIDKALLHHEERVLSSQSAHLDKDQAKLDALEGHPEKEYCSQALEFSKLAQKAQEEKVIDEDLFETPIQPLK